METLFIVVTYLLAVGVGFAFGRIKGYTESQPRRDAKGRFIKER